MKEKAKKWLIVGGIDEESGVVKRRRKYKREGKKWMINIVLKSGWNRIVHKQEVDKGGERIPWLKKEELEKRKVGDTEMR